MYRVIYAVYANEGMTADEFSKYWVDVHGAIGKRLPHVDRYELYPVLAADGELGPGVAGFALLEFESKEAFEAAGASDVMQEAVDDVPNFARHMTAYTVSGHKIF